MSSELIDARTGEILPVDPQSPVEFMNSSRVMAKVLMDVVETQRLYSYIQGKKYLRLEAWQFLAGLAHITPRTREITEIHDNGSAVGVRVYVELIRDPDCAIIGGAYGRCDYSERIARSGRFAAESMAQTRATSKAISQKLRFVPILAGYAGTPADEMTGVEPRPVSKPRPIPKPKWAMKGDDEIQADDDPRWEAPAEGNPEGPGGEVAQESAKSTPTGSVAEDRGTSGETPQPSAGSHPAWIDEPLPKIQSRPNWAGKTWRWLSEGEATGDRHKWANSVLHNAAAGKPLKLRCEYVVYTIENRGK